MKSLIIDSLIAVGTLMVAAAAIWGDWLRSWLAPTKLIIEPHNNLRGDPTVFKSRDTKSTQPATRVMYFHLKVVNQRPWLSVKNCRVLLKGMNRRGPDGRFYPIPMSVPNQFVWAPAEITPPVVTLVKEQILDLGFITETEDKFIPTLYSYSNNFQGFVHKDEAVRYHLEIEATNFSSPCYQVLRLRGMELGILTRRKCGNIFPSQR
ncbi:MAG: hypothetical protein A2512_10710 [Deltaproteobacteria bacterium RIFOXYD12_FULL_56_24]|nr:MAG: hypothetical protein A2512_10710 [Deltaproteobacteria bacterium RIFOXYD12_FULL_56_24]